jgi:hypothetical protein
MACIRERKNKSELVRYLLSLISGLRASVCVAVVPKPAALSARFEMYPQAALVSHLPSQVRWKKAPMRELVVMIEGLRLLISRLVLMVMVFLPNILAGMMGIGPEPSSRITHVTFLPSEQRR